MKIPFHLRIFRHFFAGLALYSMMQRREEYARVSIQTLALFAYDQADAMVSAALRGVKG